jgi:hypothetical protein
MDMGPVVDAMRWSCPCSGMPYTTLRAPRTEHRSVGAYATLPADEDGLWNIARQNIRIGICARKTLRSRTLIVIPSLPSCRL